MMSISRVFLAALLVAATQAATITCPAGQGVIADNGHTQCCPGVGIVDENNEYCCVGSTNLTSGCKAKVYVDDPNYTQKVQAALGESSSSTASSASSAATSSASTNTGSGSNPGTTSTSDPAKTGAAGSNAPLLGMIAGLAAVPVVMYTL